MLCQEYRDKKKSILQYFIMLCECEGCGEKRVWVAIAYKGVCVYTMKKKKKYILSSVALSE